MTGPAASILDAIATGARRPITVIVRRPVGHVVSSLLLFLSIICLPALEVPPVTAVENNTPATGKVVAALIDWAAGGESSGSLQAGAENFLKGGEYGPAILGYEKARIICDTLRFWQDDKLTAVKRLVPSRVLVEPGPFGQLKDRVILDSRACRLPQIGFRGLLKPERITVDRLPQDAAMPLAVRFKAVLTQVGDFFGELRTDQGWTNYAGWAQEIEMIIRGDIDPQLQELTNLRLETLHLFGRKQDGDTPRETALIMRLPKPFDEGRSAKAVEREATIGGSQAMTISLFFDDQGAMVNGKCKFYGDFQGWGDDDLFNNTKKASPASVPALLPADRPVQP